MNMQYTSAEGSRYEDVLKSVLYVGLLRMGHKAAGYEARKHMLQLQSIGVGKVEITVKGIPLSEPDVCALEFDIAHVNPMVEG